MFAKISRVFFVVLATAVAGCDQLANLAGFGQPTRVRSTRAPRPTAPADTSTPAATPTPEAKPAFTPPAFLPGETPRPTPTPESKPSFSPPPFPRSGALTADLVDLGDGVKEFDFSQSRWAADRGGDHVAVATVLADTAGQVHILVERMCTLCYHPFPNSEEYDAPLREGHAILSDLGSDSATFSVVAEREGRQREYFAILRNVDSSAVTYRQGLVRRVQAEIAPATTSPDVVGLLDPASKSYSLGDVMPEGGYASAVLSEDAEARWDARNLPLNSAGMPKFSYVESEPVFGDPPQWPGPLDVGSAFSVGQQTALRVMPNYNLNCWVGVTTHKWGCESSDPAELLWVYERNTQKWRPLAAPGKVQLTPTGTDVWWKDLPFRWKYRDAWYSARWKAHFAWVGNATGRLFLREDK